jgi:hypothetical protein
MVVLYRVELSYAIVLMFQSNWLLFELSSRGVVRSCWPDRYRIVGRCGAQSKYYFFFSIYNRQLSSFGKKKDQIARKVLVHTETARKHDHFDFCR